MPEIAHSYTIAPESASKRIDVFLSAKLEDVTRSRIKTLIDKGNVTVNDKKVKPSYKVCATDIVAITIPEAIPTEVIPQDIPLDIVFEDDQIIVVNKPSGMVVHPAAGNPDKTLVNALLAHCDDLSGIGGEMRPGIVHRLDKGTSGVIIVAKNDNAHNILSKQFSDRLTQKEYLGIVLGKPPEDSGTWDQPIGRHPVYRKLMSVNSRSSKPAVTHYKVLAGKVGLTALSLRIETGRTHQIRVHCKSAGCPIAHDEIYSGMKRIKRIKNDAIRILVESLERPALHAYKLALRHPVSGELMEFEAAPPEDLRQIFELLGVDK
jgi:23S rRNA pseudouridine1911/1915/1917 synthase